MSNEFEKLSLRCDTALIDFEDTIISRFERQVKANPDKLALITAETSLNYQALDLKACRIAAALTTLPSERGPIILLINDEADFITAMLGALKAGRIFVPISADSPAQWITQVIIDSGAKQIVVDGPTRPTAQHAAQGSIAILEVNELKRSQRPFANNKTTPADDAAYIVYTSGSTGLPKGVVISHRSLIRRVYVASKFLRPGDNNRCAKLRSAGVAAGINETLSPLLSGSCLFPFDLLRQGLHKLASWLIAHDITYISLSGSLLRTWLASLPNDLQLRPLRFVRMGGEAVYVQDVVRLSQHLAVDCRIMLSYSSTECIAIAAQVFTASRLLRADDVGILSVGHPAEGVEVFIKEETGAPVPSGEIGEIVVRSRFLTQGYWNNPELTAKVFKTDPHDKFVRSYHTGDLGRWRSDGTLELVGRKGRRINLRGYNIEPFQVESELMRLPGVTDAVVVLHEGNEGHEPCLVGYVVAPPDLSPAAMRATLGERLPSYMVPSHIVILGSFPIARSGKFDFKALPPPQLGSSGEGVFRLPSNDRERELCAIWQEVLEIPKIGIDDDFFDLGGTSLQALLLFAKIEARLGRYLSPTTLVQAPTVARLAELVEANTGIAETQSLVPLRASGKGLPLFLVSGRTWVAMFYRHLVNDLKSDRPVYGLQPPPLDGKHRIARTVEATAAEYIAEIRRVQPHGPYFLAGHSFGGWVSFEIAQQFAAAGEFVDFLGLIDTLPNGPVANSPLVSEVVHVGHRVRHVHTLRDLLFQGQRYIRNAALDVWFRQGHSVPYKYRPEYFAWVCTRVSRAYVPKPYAGHVTMFSSMGVSGAQRDYWTPLACGGLTVLKVQAEHVDMILPPHSKRLAELVEECLSAASVRQ